MPVAVNTSGAQLVVINTEHTLATITAAGVYQLALDLNAMVGGTTPDLLIVRSYGKASTSDTERLMERWEFIGNQGSVLWRSNPEISPHFLRYTIQQIQGTVRTYPWAVYTV
jgi:hypothetical protein